MSTPRAQAAEHAHTCMYAHTCTHAHTAKALYCCDGVPLMCDPMTPLLEAPDEPVEEADAQGPSVPKIEDHGCVGGTISGEFPDGAFVWLSLQI